VTPEVVVSGIDEDQHAGAPAELALSLAEHKARTVMRRLTRPAEAPATAVTVVLGCDSVLELGGVAYGKPTGPEQAVARWRDMRGRQGVLHTGHCLIRLAEATGAARTVSASASAVVRFGTPSDDEIDAYVATGEPLVVAGGFTLDRLGGWFVDGIDGDPGTVLGVSLPLLRRLLGELQVDVPDLWRS
jgi:septum formation protein